MGKRHNYKKIDQQSQYKFRAERLKAANDLGYETIAEAIIATYRRTSSARATAEVVGNMTSAAVYDFLHKWKEPIRG